MSKQYAELIDAKTSGDYVVYYHGNKVNRPGHSGNHSNHANALETMEWHQNNAALEGRGRYEITKPTDIYEVNVAFIMAGAIPSGDSGSVVTPPVGSLHAGKYVTPQVANSPQPGINLGVVDPISGLTIKRRSPVANTSATNYYSRHQGYNQSGTKFIGVIESGNRIIYDIDPQTGDWTVNVSGAFLGSAAIDFQWLNDDEIIWIPGGDSVVKKYTVSTGVTDHTYRDLGPLFETALNSTTINFVGTGAEGSLDKNMTKWSLKCWFYDNTDQSVTFQGIVQYDLVNNVVVDSLSDDQLIAEFGAGNINGSPNHVSTSINGGFSTWGWHVPYGSWATPWGELSDFTKWVQIGNRSQHVDTCIDTNGDEVSVRTIYDGDGEVPFSNNEGSILMMRLSDGQETNLGNIYKSNPPFGADFSTGMHISGRALDLPGWALISTYDASFTQASEAVDTFNPAHNYWLTSKLIAIKLDPSPITEAERIKTLSHIQQGAPSGGVPYFCEAFASVNRDFSQVVVGFDWGAASPATPQLYTVDIPAGALV